MHWQSTTMMIGKVGLSKPDGPLISNQIRPLIKSEENLVKQKIKKKTARVFAKPDISSPSSSLSSSS